ncbi:UNVERIFIED_CONTAM: hypothetical protein RMT77_004599 [Armadillidium vulgare]
MHGASALRTVKSFLVTTNQVVLKNYWLNNLHKVRKLSTNSLCLARQRNSEFRFYQVPVTQEDEDAQHKIEEEREKETSFKQNKSGLRSHHYRIEHNKMPSLTEDELEVSKLRQYRKYFGSHGKSSNIDLKALWPSTFELKYMKEKERVEFPHTVQEMIAMAKEKRHAEEQAIWERQEELKENMKKLDKWKKDLRARVEKKELEAKRFMVIKEKQVEDVREILGYNISPHDPKFKEILEKKIEEDKKRAKKEKKLRKKQIELERLQEAAQREAMEAEASHAKSKTEEENENKT